MIRSELVERLAEENPELRPAEIEAVTAVFLDTIIDSLANGGRVELRGFGAFSVRPRDGREGRNPRTGQTVVVPPKYVAHFKAGKEIRARLNGE